MIVPKKHLNFSQSLLGFGSFILNALSEPMDIDSIWNNYLGAYRSNQYPAKHSFDNLVLTILYLYLVGAISEENGVIKRCN